MDKPPGVPAQPTLTSDRGALPELVSDLLGAPVTLVHRLDRETSGVTVLARTRQAAAALAEAFRMGGPAKTYLALTARPPEPAEGVITLALGKDPTRPGLRRVDPAGDPAMTRYRTLRAGPGAALVEARPETGRTHQIRVHLSEAGHPLLADATYGGRRREARLAAADPLRRAAEVVGRQALHACSLAFEAEPAEKDAMLPPEEAMEYNQKIQLSCNHAIFDTFLELAGLADQWKFNFPSQLCMTNQYCEFTFVRKAFDKK